MINSEIVAVAVETGIQNWAMFPTKRQLIRAIQKARGEKVCFQSDVYVNCATQACTWRRECTKLVAEWQR